MPFEDTHITHLFETADPSGIGTTAERYGGSDPLGIAITDGDHTRVV